MLFVNVVDTLVCKVLELLTTIKYNNMYKVHKCECCDIDFMNIDIRKDISYIKGDYILCGRCYWEYYSMCNSLRRYLSNIGISMSISNRWVDLGLAIIDMCIIQNTLNLLVIYPFHY